MKCTKCNKEEARFFMEKNINGHVTKVALCPKCARDFDREEFFGKDNFFPDFFENNKVLPDEFDRPQMGLTIPSLFGTIRMPSYRDFYKIFSDEISSMTRDCIDNEDGNECKEIPKRIGNKDSKYNEIKELKAQLKQAVKKEEYEQAAVLRDKIKELESSKESTGKDERPSA